MFGFRLFIEAQEAHPFEVWHKDYATALKSRAQALRAARDNEVRQRRTAYRKSHGLEPLPDDLKVSEIPAHRNDPGVMVNDPRARSLSVVPVLKLRGSSSGWHGWGDTPEVPAGNPAANAEWTFLLNPAVEGKLVGRTAFMTSHERGSYHERFFNAAVYVITDLKDQDDDEIHAETISQDEYEHIIKFFKFKNLNQTIKLAQKEIDGLSSPIKPGESSQDFWNRLLQKFRPTQHPLDTHDYSDDYWKRRST